MAEYIDRDAIYKAFANACTDVLERVSEIDYIAGFSYELVIGILDNIPTVDVAPVVHGRWDITEGMIENAVCSNCGRHFQSYYEAYHYCPNCGAKMDIKVQADV